MSSQLILHTKVFIMATLNTNNAARSNVRLQFVIVVVGALLLIAKFLAYYITQSNTILTDALESIVNVVAGILGLYSLVIASLPKDENHPYGHGKIEFISAGVEGTLIVIAGILIIVKSIYSFIFPNDIQDLDKGIYITGAAGAVNYILGMWAVKQGEKTNSLALIASGKHLKSDTYSTIGLLGGLILIWITDWQWLDSIAAIVFGIIIAITGYKIVKESVAGIMDEADYELISDIVKTLQDNRENNWVDIHNLRVIKYGGALHIDCHLTVPNYFTIEEGHEEVDAVEHLFNQKVKDGSELFIHLDPCLPTSCHLCAKANCPIRSFAYIAQQEWTLQNVMRNQKHGLH